MELTYLIVTTKEDRRRDSEAELALHRFNLTALMPQVVTFNANLLPMFLPGWWLPRQVPYARV
jgi:hypothetical protein